MCLVGGVQQQVIVYGTDSLIQELEDLQVSLGQGPGIEAVRSGVPILPRDLAEHRAVGWEVYNRHATALGVRAVFALPLRAGTVPFGASDLYRDAAWSLTAGQSADALELTDMAIRAMSPQQDAVYTDGTVSALRWLAIEHRSTTPGRGGTVDLGLTVAEALAAAGADGGNGMVGPEAAVR